MNKTLIAYASKYGSVEKCALSLQQKLQGEIDIIDLQKTKIEDLSPYDTVIIGGSIYAGKIQGVVSSFTEKFLEDLLKKRIGLFICCADNKKQDMQLKAAVPEVLFDHTTAKGYFGYEFNMDKMKFVDKTVIKSMLKIKESQFKILDEKIDDFADGFKIVIRKAE